MHDGSERLIEQFLSYNYKVSGMIKRRPAKGVADSLPTQPLDEMILSARKRKKI